MSASVDNTAQVVEVGALVELDANVLSHGIAFVSKDHPPMHMTFSVDETGNILNYSVDPVALRPNAQLVSFVKVGRVLEKPSVILGVQKTPKLILPGA